MFSDASGVASIVGLLISIWLLTTINSIKKQFHARARLPGYNKEIGYICSRLSEKIQEIPATLNSVSTEIHKLIGNLKSISNVTPKALNSDRKKLLKMARVANTAKAEVKKDRCWELYTETLSFSVRIKNHLEDLKLGDK